jgi:hypothetical protein
MTATQTTTTQVLLQVLDPNHTQHWMEVHKAGCAHLRRGKRGDNSWTLEVSTLEELAQELGQDFLAEGSMTLADVIESTFLAPCVKLPREEQPIPTPRKARKPRKLAAVPDPTPAVEEPTPAPKRKALPNAERRSEATHPEGGSAVSHGKCPTCGARKGHVCSSSKTGPPTNFVHAPRMRAWEAAGSPSLPMPTPARKVAGVWVVVK